MTTGDHRTGRRAGRASAGARAGVVAATAALAALSLAACGSDSGSGTSSTSTGGTTSAGPADYGTVKVQLSWIKNEEFAGEFFADSKGYFKTAGFSGVTLTPGPSTGAAELLSGKTDIALSDAVSIGSVVGKEDAPLKVIGATYQKNPFTILSLTDKGNIATPKDMVGKKIGVQDSNTALFKALLAANGLTDKQVTIVPVQYDPSVLVNGQVDGFVAYLTNEAITVASQGHKVTNLPFADNGLPFVAETVTTTEDTIKSKRAMLEAFLTAEIKGWTDNIKDPAAGTDLAVKTYGKDLKLDPANSLAGNKKQVTDLVVSDETKTNGLFTISSALQAETIKSLAGAGITVTADKLFDMSLLDDVYKANPGLKSYGG